MAQVKKNSANEASNWQLAETPVPSLINPNRQRNAAKVLMAGISTIVAMCDEVYDEWNPKMRKTVIRLLPMFGDLREAHDFAQQVAIDPWQFAVEIRLLRNGGASDDELNALTRAGYVNHATESTPARTERRCFQHSPELEFCDHSCFVLSPKGLETLQGIENGKNGSGKWNSNKPMVPSWNPVHHELVFAGQFIKRFKWRAPNQERMLMAFQRQGWPEKIQDPLPADEQVDPKRRLHDTIKCLNRRHSRKLIRFHGDGTGTGVIWRVVETRQIATLNEALMEPGFHANGSSNPGDALVNGTHHKPLHELDNAKRKSKKKIKGKSKSDGSTKSSMTLGRI